MDKGAFVEQPDGTFSVDPERIAIAVHDLDHELLTLEAEGNYAGAKKMLDELGVVRPNIRKALSKLEGIPTDIEPIYVTADELAPNAKTSRIAKPKSTKHRR
jgi:hypothetical protein